MKCLNCGYEGVEVAWSIGSDRGVADCEHCGMRYYVYPDEGMTDPEEVQEWIKALGRAEA